MLPPTTCQNFSSSDATAPSLECSAKPVGSLQSRHKPLQRPIALRCRRVSSDAPEQGQIWAGLSAAKRQPRLGLITLPRLPLAGDFSNFLDNEPSFRQSCLIRDSDLSASQSHR